MARGGANKKKADGSKLSPLGQELERALVKTLKELDKTEKVTVGEGEAKKEVDRPIYSFLDRLRVFDRVIKLEGIKHKITDDDGSFFNEPGGAADGTEE